VSAEYADTLELGTCCICEGERGITTIIMLPFKNQVPGHGWGCFACHLPTDGASAVLCDACADEYVAGRANLKFACRGYPAEDGRVAFDALTIRHEHDPQVEH
jgi:hypothetical protein